MIRKILSLPLRILVEFSDSLARWARGFQRRIRVGQGPSRITGRADRWFSKFLSAMVSPLVTLGHSVERLSGRRRKVSVNVKADQERLHRKLQRDQARGEARDRMKRSWMVRVPKLLLLPIVSFGVFCWTLLRTRSRALFWWSMPLVVVVGAIGLVIYQTAFVDQRRIAARYETAVAQAISAGDLKQAELFQRKLEQLGVRTDQGEFNTALAIGQSGDIEAAARRMEAIASPDAIGNPSAHFWLAQQLIDDKIARYQFPVNHELALAHLSRLKQQTGDRPEISFLKALALAKLGRLDESAAAFGESPREFLDAAGLKMQVELARGEETAARTAAMTVRRHLSKILENEAPLTESQSRLDVDSSELLDDAQAAALAVKRWYKSNPNSPRARSRKAELQLREFDRWLSDPQQLSVVSAAEQLVESSQLIPDEQIDAMRQRLDKIVKGRGNPTIDAAYQALLDSPETSGVALEFLATAAAAKEDWAAADRIYSIAAKRSPSFSRIWNNWAYVLDTGFPERRATALVYANKAVALQPDIAAYYGTRGIILVHLKKWKEAVEDLKIALHGSRDQQSIHEALAQAYSELGKTGLAGMHKQAAQ